MNFLSKEDAEDNLMRVESKEISNELKELTFGFENKAERLISVSEDLEPLIELNNSNFAIRLEHYHYQTKDKTEATEFYHIEKDAKEGVRILKELKNPNLTHKYNAKKCIVG